MSTPVTLARVRHRVWVSALLLTSLARPSFAQVAPLPDFWVGLSAGLGFAAVPVTRRDTVYEGSPQATFTVDVGVSIGQRLGISAELSRGVAFGGSDCLPGFSVCAPEVTYTALAASVRHVRTTGFPVFIGGVGGYRLREGSTGEKATALGLHVGVEGQILTGGPGGLSGGARLIVLPNAPGEPITMVSLYFALRGWPRPFAAAP